MRATLPLTISTACAGFRSAAAQAMLSRLAGCDRVHLVASFDHVNTPLLWDKRLAARFNWLWHDVTTYAPYTAEVAAAALPSLLVGRRCPPRRVIWPMVSIGERVRSTTELLLLSCPSLERRYIICLVNRWYVCSTLMKSA